MTAKGAKDAKEFFSLRTLLRSFAILAVIVFFGKTERLHRLQR
jgi:hypothetical protein